MSLLSGNWFANILSHVGLVFHSINSQCLSKVEVSDFD